MTRHWLAFVAATALTGIAAPATAQNAPPPPPAPSPAWTDPQAPIGADGHALPAGPGDIGAPFAHPLPPGIHPEGPMPHPGGPMPYPGGPMMWHGGGSGFVAEDGYEYGPGPGATACGCGGYTMTWVPIRIETRYHYSPAIRHERDVVEEHVVNQEVTERYITPVRATKYTKHTPIKMTKQTKQTKKAVHHTK